MAVNVGALDRIVRALVGVGLLYLVFFSGLPFFEQSPYQFVAAVIAVVMLATSTLKMCPLYSLFGIKTCKEC